MIKIKEKSALILGGCGGIGIEISKRLLKEGFNVMIGYHNDTSRDWAKKELVNTENISFYKIEVTDEFSVKDSITKAIKYKGKIDSVVYSVSIPITNNRISNLIWKDFQDQIDVQLKGFFNVIKAFELQIKEGYPIKFVVILTEYCLGRPPAMIAHYVSAKYALMGFTKSMAAELSNTKCTFNMVSPGMVNTKLISSLPPKLVEITAERNPQKRIALASDIAGVISFLLSKNSDYLNGVNIPINGGNIFI